MESNVWPSESPLTQAAMKEVGSDSSSLADALVGRLLAAVSLLTDLSQTRHAEAILVAKNKRLALKNDQYEMSLGVGGSARHNPKMFPPFQAIATITDAIPSQ
jgi:hypothetical protein